MNNTSIFQNCLSPSLDCNLLCFAKIIKERTFYLFLKQIFVSPNKAKNTSTLTTPHPLKKISEMHSSFTLSQPVCLSLGPEEKEAGLVAASPADS